MNKNKCTYGIRDECKYTLTYKGNIIKKCPKCVRNLVMEKVIYIFSIFITLALISILHKQFNLSAVYCCIISIITGLTIFTVLSYLVSGNILKIKRKR